MARFYLGEDTAEKDLWGEGKYPYVDLRGKIPGNPQPNQGTVYKDSGVIWHWNGPKVVNKDLDQLAIDARYHMRPDAFGPGATPNGIQYEWAIGHDGTKYRLRNPGASLWHCGNAHHNVKSFAATFLIGEGQRITAAAKESARELTDALLRIQGLGRSACRGHRDVNPSTCPGTAYADFVLPYRAGALTSAPKPPTAPILPRPSSLHDPGSGPYVRDHPTHYDFRPDVREMIVRYLNHPRLKGKIWICTYRDHPPGWGLDAVSWDVWDWAGRGHWLTPALRKLAFDIIFNDPEGPKIWWIISGGGMWTDTGGWEDAPAGPPDSDPDHIGHIHITNR